MCGPVGLGGERVGRRVTQKPFARPPWHGPYNPDVLEAAVDSAGRIGALDFKGFHLRKAAHLYEKYTALYEEATDLVETHQDFWQSGMTEHYVFVAKESYGATVPENFSSLVPRASSTGRPHGQPKGSKRPGAVPKQEPRVRTAGRGGRGRGRRQRPATEADPSTEKDTVDLESFSGKGGGKTKSGKAGVCR